MLHPLQMSPIQTVGPLQTSVMSSNYTYQTSVHPFQMSDTLHHPHPHHHHHAQGEATTPPGFGLEVANDPSCSPPSSSSSPGGSPPSQGFGQDMEDTHANEYAGYNFPRHASVGSLYPLTQSHELMEPLSTTTSSSHKTSRFDLSASMASSLSSTSISSSISLPSHPHSLQRSYSIGGIPMTTKNSHGAATVASAATTLHNSNLAKPKQPQRRASLNPDVQGRVFTCIFSDCGKLFKRSEHLKRHVRSVHTLEKPFLCSYPGCPKKFSRSDNLNQHVRIHRHDKEKTVAPKPFTNFTPFCP